MAKSTQSLTIIHRIMDAVNKIGITNGTLIKEPEYNGEEKSNESRVQWFERWNAIREYLVAATVYKRAEKRADDAKELLKAQFSEPIAKLNIDDTVSHVFGNVAVAFNLRNGQSRISRDSVMHVMLIDYEWSHKQVDELLAKIEKTGKPALYITPSTTSE